MSMPFGLGPKFGDLLPSLPTVSAETSVHVPTSCSFIVFAFCCAELSVTPPNIRPAMTPATDNSLNAWNSDVFISPPLVREQPRFVFRSARAPTPQLRPAPKNSLYPCHAETSSRGIANVSFRPRADVREASYQSNSPRSPDQAKTWHY